MIILLLTLVIQQKIEGIHHAKKQENDSYFVNYSNGIRFNRDASLKGTSKFLGY